MVKINKVPAWQIARALNKPVKEVIEIGLRVTSPEERSGGANGKPIVWYLPEAAERIKQAAIAPLTVARRFKAFALHEARNPRWMFCKLAGVEGKVPVAIPRKLIGKLVRKNFEVEAIEDVRGITYRHASLAPRAP